MSRGANGHGLAQKYKREAEEFAAQMRWMILDLIAQGHPGPTALAKELNRLGRKTRAGGKWYPATIARVLQRLELPPQRGALEPQAGLDQEQLYSDLRRQVEAGMWDRIGVR